MSWVSCKALDVFLLSRHTSGMQKLCAKCGAPMTCQPEGGCWCAELPHIPMPSDLESTGCLCRTCLLEKIKAAEAARAKDSPENTLPTTGS